jgi:hypothetical protein
MDITRVFEDDMVKSATGADFITGNSDQKFHVSIRAYNFAD